MKACTMYAYVVCRLMCVSGVMNVLLRSSGHVVFDRRVCNVPVALT